MAFTAVKYLIKAPARSIYELFIKLFFVIDQRRHGSTTFMSTEIKNGSKIKNGSGSRLGKFAALKCYRNGTITLGTNCRIEDFSIIESMSGSVTFGDDSTLNQFSIIRAWGDVRIGSGVRIGPSVHIMAMKHNFDDPDKYIFEQGISGTGISIGDNVWIGGNACILDGVNIGRNCVIGAGSVVTKDIPENSIAVGNPAQVIKKLNSNIRGGQND